MSTTEVWIELATLSFAVAGLIAAFAGPFRWARTASWRQDLFEIRNELWDRMRERGTLDTPAHRKVRRLINASIRVAPSFNLFGFLYVVLRCPRTDNVTPPKVGRPIHDLIAEVSDPVAAAELHKAMEAVIYSIVRRLFITTFPGLLIGIPVVVMYRCFTTAKFFIGLRDRCRAGLRSYLDSVGDLEPAAMPA